MTPKAILHHHLTQLYMHTHMYVQSPLLLSLVVMLPEVAVPSLAWHVKYGECKATECDTQQQVMTYVCTYTSIYVRIYVCTPYTAYSLPPILTASPLVYVLYVCTYIMDSSDCQPYEHSSLKWWSEGHTVGMVNTMGKQSNTLPWKGKSFHWKPNCRNNV